MRKEFNFEIKGHQIKVTNSWFLGAKLYVDGDLRDFDKTFIALGNKVLMSANLGQFGTLEIIPLSAAFSVELDAYLVHGDARQHVFSSHKRLSLSEQRLAQ